MSPSAFFSPFIILFFHAFMFYVMVLNVSLLALFKHNFAQNNQLTTKSHHLRCNVLCNNSSITELVTVMAWLLCQERQHCDKGWVLFWWKKKLLKKMCAGSHIHLSNFTKLLVRKLTRSELEKRFWKHGTHLTPQDTYPGLRESKTPLANPEV